MSLPESKQDASLAGTYEARPGASDANPAGLSSSTNNTNLSSSVKSSLDSVADSTPTTSTQSVTESLPSAQEAADAVKAGANSLVAGVSNLALGVNNVVAGNASAAHPESDNARNVDDLHVPGAFDDATDDAEDKAAVQKGLQSAYNTLPSVKDVTNTLPTTHDMKNPLPDTSAVSQKIPNISGNSDSVGGNSRQGDIHQDGIDHIKGQLQGQTSAYNTTSQLAGQVPLEPRGVPHVVSDSQHQAGVSPEAASNAEAVLEKKQLERELKREVPESQSTISSANPISSAAGLDRGVPQVVADSQKKADVSPEASANAEAVQEKRDVERQLKREVGQQPGTDNTPVNLGEAVSGGLVSAGAAIAGAATYARQKTHESTGTDPVAVLPESAQQAIDGEVTNPSTSRGPQSSSNLSNIDGQSIKNTLAGGVAAAGSATADAATYARQKTHEATGTDPVSVLPQSAQQAIDGDTASSTSSRGLGSGSQQSGLTDSLAAGASSAGSAAAGAAAFAREKTHEATGTDPVSVLPTSAQRNIDGGKTGGDLSQTSDKFPRVVGEPVVGGSSSSTSDIFPRVVGEPVVGGHSSGVDLHSGVHNGVVGDHLDDESKSAMRSSSGSHSGHWQPGTSATVAHIPSLRDVDLSAGVKNTVVGSGAEAGEESAQ